MPDSTPLKRCTKCGIEKPATLEFFGLDRRNKNGLQGRCKSCARIANSLYAKTHPEKVRERYRKKHIKYRERDNARNRKYQAEHREASLARSKAWAEKNKELARERARQWAKDHPEKVRRNAARWKKENPDKVHINEQRRRTRKRNLEHTFSFADWDRALKFFGGCCAVCGKPPGLWHTLAQDHWIPVSKGGEFTRHNVIPLCHSMAEGADGCNNSKHNSDPVEWLNRRVGPRKAKEILSRIEAYFDSLKEDVS